MDLQVRLEAPSRRLGRQDGVVQPVLQLAQHQLLVRPQQRLQVCALQRGLGSLCCGPLSLRGSGFVSSLACKHL